MITQNYKFMDSLRNNSSWAKKKKGNGGGGGWVKIMNSWIVLGTIVVDRENKKRV